MEIKIGKCKPHNTKTYIEVMDYINELTTKHQLQGDYNFINLVDYHLGLKKKLVKTTDAILRMRDTFYDCIDGLEYLGALYPSDNNKEGRCTKYSIDKHCFIVCYALFCTLDESSERNIRTLNRNNISSKLKCIIINILECSSSNSIYKSKEYSHFLKRFYSNLYQLTMSSICGSTKHLNDYSIFYSSLNQASSRRPYNNNNSSLYVRQFERKLSEFWFTNQWNDERRIDVKALEKYYEEYLSKNEYIRPLIDYLDSNFNTLSIEDVIVPLELVKKLPGKSLEKKKNILISVAHYYAIKKAELINYTLGIIEDIKTLEERYRMNVNIKLTNMANGSGVYAYKIRISARMTNDFCQTHKLEHCTNYFQSREYILETLGFDSNSSLDLHSAIFTIAKAINKRELLKLEYDIKKELEKLKIRGTIDGKRRLLKYKDFKGLLFYMFFSRHINEAYNHYHNRFNAKYHQVLKHFLDQYDIEMAYSLTNEAFETIEKEINKKVAKVSKRDFEKIYRFIQDETGGTTNFIYNIFVIESAIEALTVSTLVSKGYDIKNVYDCFYWKEEQVSKDEIESTIVDCSNKVFNRYYQLNKDINNLHLNNAATVQVSYIG